jgi:Putative metal-binding motif
VSTWLRLLSLCAPLCAACTLIELSSEVTQSQCTEHYDCDVLNLPTSPGFNRCMIWQCGESQICELARLDLDHDGFEPEVCAPPGKGDCDDENPLRTPGRPEVCDGEDNDCDLRTDEGSLGLAPARAVTFDAPLDDLTYSWSPRTGELSLAYSLRGEPSRPGVVTLVGDTPVRAGPLPLESLPDELQAGTRQVGIGAMFGIRRLALAMIEPVAPQRIWVGNVFGQEQPALSLDNELVRRGLRCAPAEACAPVPGMDTLEPTASTPASAHPTLSALGEQILVASTRIPNGVGDACELAEAEQPQTAVLNVLLDPDPAPPQELTTVAVPLDELGEARSPALLAVDTNLISGDREFGWLAGYGDTEGRLVVRRVTRGLELPTEDLVRVRERERRFSHVQLATGLVEPGRTLIGVVAQLGCGDDARIIFVALQAIWSASGKPALGVFREPIRIDPEGGERPSLAFNNERRNWGVVFAHRGTLFARELDLNGMPIGDASYALGDAGSLEFVIVPGISPAPDSFRVYSYHEQDEPALEVVHLRACE